MSVRLNEVIDRNINSAPHSRCFWWNGVWYDQAFMKGLVDDCEAKLREAGFTAGQRLVVLTQNCPMMAALSLAVWRLGGSICPLNVKVGITYLTATLDLLEPFAVVLSEETKKEIASVLDEHGWPYVICPPMGPLPSFKGRLGAPESSELAVIFSTSGTTGTPKAVPISHENVYHNCLGCIECLGDGLKPGDVMLNVLPNFHAFGFTISTIFPFIYKGCQAIVPSFMPPQKAMKALNDAQVNIVILIPTMLSFILAMVEKGAQWPASVKLLIAGGDRYNSSMDERAQDILGISVLEGYGITECSPVVSCNRNYERKRLGTVGEIFSSYQWQLRSEDGKPLDGSEGVLWLKGPCVASGYFRTKEADKSRFDEGWFNTGDYVRVKDGYLTIMDRVTDIIIVGGFNVYPQEVEALLNKHPAVMSSVVVGVPNQTSGEIPKAYIQKKTGVDVTESDIIRYCKDGLAHYKVPRKVEFVDSLPLSATGKILRRVLRDRERQNEK